MKSKIYDEKPEMLIYSSGTSTTREILSFNLKAYVDRVNQSNKLVEVYLHSVMFVKDDYEEDAKDFEPLTEIPAEIFGLENLVKLDLDGNRIKSIDKNILRLTKLKILSLGHNELEVLPGEIFGIESLEELDLSFNKLSKLPADVVRLKSLKKLNLSSNSLQIPVEIIRTLDSQKILNYYFSIIEKDRKPINETKLLVVGQGSVGKTSLLQQILYGLFDQNQNKTEGISIIQWQIQGGGKQTSNSQIKLNIWDFGGQEIMHATHQFFLTERSLYLLVLDARLTQEENRVEYWLKIIQSFGGESPVLIIGNKTDQHPLDIDRTGLQKKYPNIVGVLETAAATGKGIEALKVEIAKQVDAMPHVRDLLPQTWFTVKSKLEKIGKEKNFIVLDEYLRLCDTNDVTDETSKRTLIGFLHDLGIVLHFQDDSRLEALGILNPQWVTNGVYKILNSHELFQNQGTLTLPMLNKILDMPEYPRDKRLFVVDMMKKFELGFDIEPDKSFLIPDLLPKDEPFTGEWSGALAFQIHYNILPSSIISRFIVRMNTFVYKTVWRLGVVLKRGANTALVKADIEDHKIYIWVSGYEATRRDMLSAIRLEFDAIHKTIAKIEATEKVPIPDAPEATPIDYEFLLRLEKEGRESLPVQAGIQIVDLIVKEVLSRIESERGNILGVGEGIDGSTVVSGNNNVITINQPISKKKRK